MKKLLSVFLAIVLIVTTLTGCAYKNSIADIGADNATNNDNNENYTNETDSFIAEKNLPTLFSNWILLLSSHYYLISITNDAIEIISSGGYNEYVDFDYEESTGYIYCYLDFMVSDVCIVPISNTQCVLTYPVGQFGNEGYSKFETFSTSRGEFYKYGISIFKQDDNIDEYIAKWTVIVDNYSEGRKLYGLELNIQNQFYNDDSYFLSLDNGKIFAIIDENRWLQTSFYAQKENDKFYLYNANDIVLTYYGNNFKDIVEQFKNNNDDKVSISKNSVIYYENEHIILEKTGNTTSNYPKAIPVDENTNFSNLLVGSWQATNEDDVIWTFYSDGSCSPNDYESALHIEADYEGSGGGRWSFVDNKLKIAYGTYYGSGNGVMYHNYRFIDSNTLLIYNPLESKLIDPIIYFRLSN